MTMYWDLAESERLKQQENLDSCKTQFQRNQLGQFATSSDLAKEITAYLYHFWKKRKDKVRFLDPAFGTGSFYSALLRVFPPSLLESATGIEIDTSFVNTARLLWQNTKLEVLNADFTKLSPPENNRKFNLILTNPPYVRHHHLDLTEKIRLKQISKEILGVDINGLAGLYCYFIILAHQWLVKDGIGAWLVPSEFMDVNYGTALKSYLTDRVTLLHVHRFDPNDLQFKDALVSSTVVIFQNSKPLKTHKVKFSFGGTLLKPLSKMMICIPKLKSARKWSGLYKDTLSNSSDYKNTITLSSLFSIKRGIATGANNFFILPIENAHKLNIDERFLTPILPSPRYLRETIIESDKKGYPIIENQFVLINSDLPESKIKQICPSLFYYLEQGKKQELHQKYLATKRIPWYKQEYREPAPFLCTYMGRTTKNPNPFRFIMNKSKAIAANVYLLLYPIGPLKRALSKAPGLVDVIFQILQEICSKDLVAEGRVYGGGLYKIEPAELGRVPAARIMEELNLNVEAPAIQQTLPFV